LKSFLEKRIPSHLHISGRKRELVATVWSWIRNFHDSH